MNENGFGWSEPVLAPLDSIEHKDALLAFGDDGTVTEATWPSATCIIGNPPFLGGNRVRQELGDEYVDTLFKVYEGRVPQFADLCCYFFEKAREATSADRVERAGLLATNSIRGGANRRVLDRIKESGDIFMAWSDEPWILNGAAVRISIIGFDDGDGESKVLNGDLVETINSDLTASVDITAAARLGENSDIGFMGFSKKGAFDIPGDVAREWMSAPNPHGRSSGDVLRPLFNGKAITARWNDIWIIDFGVDMTLEEAALYEKPFEYVLEHVKPKRDQNRRQSYRERWWLHAEPRPRLRERLTGLERFLVTPTVASYRLFRWLSAGAAPDQQLIAFAREDDYFFGVLHSRAHEVWSLRMGTWLGKGNDPRYTPTTTFETFPLPWPPGEEPADDPRVVAIGDAAKRLNALRENWLNPPDASEAELKKRTLTNLYNARPTWLANAHAILDRAVWAAYGWPADEVPADVAEDVILSRLLELNQERATSIARR
jgi:type II restriction/modification system DNA methylase subunit YeeA